MTTPPRTCEHCQKPYPSRGPRSRFCSRECAWAASRRPARVCTQCGVSFIPPCRRKAQETCSRACGRAKLRTAKPRCRRCGNPCRYSWNVYCGNVCAHAHRAESGVHPVSLKDLRPVGAVWVNPNGYVYEKCADGKWRYQHRLVVARRLGRTLLKTEHVHHLNGDRADNRAENLELWTTPHPTGVRDIAVRQV